MGAKNPLPKIDRWKCTRSNDIHIPVKCTMKISGFVSGGFDGAWKPLDFEKSKMEYLKIEWFN